MTISVTFTTPRPDKPAIDTAYITGRAAVRFLETIRKYGEPAERREYPQLGVRIDRIDAE